MSDAIEMYTLIDGAQRNAESPKTFEVPSSADLAQVVEGNHVKIGVEFPQNYGEAHNGERFWVKVSSRKGDFLTGVIDNELVYAGTHGLDLGMSVNFETRHILTIMGRDEI